MLSPMKRLPLLLALVALILTMGACKTTEANYRAAYENAKLKQQESTGLDSTIYGRIRSQAMTSQLVIGSDSLPLKREYVGYPADGGSSRENLLRYNVVVGQFKQVFNARQMRQRLIDSGYESAMIVNTREPLYYVIAVTAATPEEALAAWQRVTADKNIVLRSPLPFILQPARYR